MFLWCALIVFLWSNIVVFFNNLASGKHEVLLFRAVYISVRPVKHMTSRTNSGSSSCYLSCVSLTSIVLWWLDDDLITYRLLTQRCCKPSDFHKNTRHAFGDFTASAEKVTICCVVVVCVCVCMCVVGVWCGVGSLFMFTQRCVLPEMWADHIWKHCSPTTVFFGDCLGARLSNNVAAWGRAEPRSDGCLGTERSCWSPCEVCSVQRDDCDGAVWSTWSGSFNSVLLNTLIGSCKTHSSSSGPHTRSILHLFLCDILISHSQE